MNVLAYARRLIDRCAVPGVPTPVYGSEEWSALDPSDPRRWTAVVIAAECWRTHCEETPARVAAELQAENNRCMARWQDAANDVRGERRMTEDPATWHLVSFAEYERRRAEPSPWPPKRV